MRAFQIAVLALLLTMGICQAALCQLLDANEFGATVVGSMDNSNGLYTWTYEITNTSNNPSYTMWFIAIQIDPSAEVVDIVTPFGWYVDNEQPDFIVWTYLTGELGQGEEASGFQVTYSSQPEYQFWLAQFMDFSTGDLKYAEGPVMISTLTTPEPGSMAVLLAGLAPLGALLSRRRK